MREYIRCRETTVSLQHCFVIMWIWFSCVSPQQPVKSNSRSSLHNPFFFHVAISVIIHTHTFAFIRVVHCTFHLRITYNWRRIHQLLKHNSWLIQTRSLTHTVFYENNCTRIEWNIHNCLHSHSHSRRLTCKVNLEIHLTLYDRAVWRMLTARGDTVTHKSQ